MDDRRPPLSPASFWARVSVDVDFGLRRGAWYRVVAMTPETVVLDVHGQAIEAPRVAIEVVDSLPFQWAVVPRPRNASFMIPASWGDHYGVCPHCAYRAPLFGAPAVLQCPGCGLTFVVGWEERYLGRNSGAA